MADIISFLGERLSGKIKKAVMPTTGFIRLSIKDEFGSDVNTKKLTYKDFKQVIQNSLKQRLKNIKVANLDTVIQEMLTDLQDNQSLLTMMTV